MSSPKFKVGDRVRLSELGKSRSPRVRGQVGKVIVVKSRYSVEVQFDDNKFPTRIHVSYIEADDPDLQS
jgi:hypothetical protein